LESSVTARKPDSLADSDGAYLSLRGEPLSRFTLEVLAPRFEDQLASALEAIAIIHGGAVVESSDAPTKNYHRQYVNIFDCERSLQQEVEWLRSRFPESRFTLKQFM
jgi:hypothetical protein